MKELRHLVISFLAAFVILAVPLKDVQAAAPTGTFWIAAPNELGFQQGGIRGRYLIIESWDSTTDWPINTILQHNGEMYWAESDPSSGDEPGTAAAWTQISGEAGTGTGATVTAGTADPTGGSDGDAYIQIDASNVVQSLWRNASGTWAEYTIPTAGTSTDDQTAAEVNTTTTNFGGNLSNADTTVQAALDTLDDITAGRALQTGTPIDIAATGGTGTATAVSREDHAHGGFTGPAVRDLLNALTGTNRLQGAAIRDVTAAQASTNVANFDGHLSNADTTVQAALDTLDDLTSGATLTEEQVEDFVGGMVESNTETGVAVTYDDTDGTLDFDAQTAGDTRYARLGAENTFTDKQTINAGADEPGLLVTTTGDGNDVLQLRAEGDSVLFFADATNLDGQTPFVFNISETGNQQAMWIRTGDTGQAFFVLDGNLGGAGQPGIAFGPASEAGNNQDRDVNLFRGGAQRLETDDAFHANSLSVDDLATTHVNLGIIEYHTGTVFPSIRVNDDLFEFNADATGILNAVDFDGSTAITTASRGDLFKWDAANTQWVKQSSDTGGLTFIGDTDTPNSYTNQGRQFTRVNSGETALEFVPEPANSNTIPHVGQLPDVTDDSPVLVFLTHDEITGDREDATLTIGESLGRYCGYSQGNIFDGFGSISEDSPIEMVFGIITGADCTFSSVHSFNEGFIDDIRTMVFTIDGTAGSCNLGNAYQEYGATTKRITSCTALQNVDENSFTFNFLYADGTSAYFNDGSVDHRAGLYEKVGTPPRYHDLAPPEDAHRTGEGSAACGDSNPPDAAGQLCVTSDGRAYFAMPRTSLITTPASITVAGVASDLFIPDIYETGSLEGRANLNDGNFIYIKTTQEFYQYQDPDFVVVTWEEAWQYIIDNIGDSTDRQTFLASTFLGEFASQSEVQRDRDGYTDDTVEYYFLYSDFGTLIQITAFTNSVRETISEGFAWRGPVIIPEEVLDVVEANPTDEVNEVLDSILIGSQRYSVIVRPGANGQLRAPTASDFDATYARSKVVAAVDGDFYKVSRTLTAVHTATGTFTELPRGTTFTYDGTTYRYEGALPNDVRAVHTAPNGFYYNTTTHFFRLRVSDDSGTYWTTLPNGVGLLAAWQWVDTVHNEADALAHSSANGQKFAYQDSGGDWGVYELSAFTAAEPSHYEYEWRHSTFPADDSPDNVTLVDDVSLTWNAAFRSSLEFEFSEALAEATDGQVILFDFFPNGTNAVARDPGDLILAEHVRAITEVHPLRLTKAGGGGGGDPVNQDVALLTPRPTGYIHFHLPISSGEFPDRRLTLFYTGDHITDLDGQIGTTDTTLTVSTGDTSELTVGENYWLAGPTTGDCQSSPYFEKITILTIVDGDDITVTRGVDGTGLTGLTCFMDSGADVIHDDKKTFILESTHDDQDSAQVSFTLLSQGAGSGSGGGQDAVTGGGILKAKYLVSSNTAATIDDATWTTVLTQAVTAAANDRVYIDGSISIESTSNNSQCELRVARGTTLVGAVIEADIGFNGEIEDKQIRQMDTPGAGDHTYNIQVQDNGNGDCLVNAVGTNSFGTFEVLSANP